MRAQRKVSTLAVAVATMSSVFIGCSTTNAPTSAESTSSPAPSSCIDAAAAEQFQTVLDATRTDAGFPGVIARVVSPDGTWTGTSGTIAENSTQTPLSTDRTRIGSLTKTMTATVILQLAEENILSLDDTIDRYTPSVPNGNSITVLQLANMTSGIASYTESDTIVDRFFDNPERAWTPQELVDGAVSLPPDFPPGQGWAYSNTNYVLLGMIIENILGQPIDEVFEQRLFDPLGMEDTTFPTDSIDIADRHMDGMTDQDQPPGQNADSTHWNPSFAFTAGAVISTLDDLEKWAHALFTGDGILDEQTQQLRRDSVVRDIPPMTAEVGYGIGIGDRNGSWGHDGDIPGYNTALAHQYDTDTTIIALTDSDNTFSDGGMQVSPAPAVSTRLQSATAATP